MNLNFIHRFRHIFQSMRNILIYFNLFTLNIFALTVLLISLVSIRNWLTMAI
jgi:hypothetical protein